MTWIGELLDLNLTEENSGNKIIPNSPHTFQLAFENFLYKLTHMFSKATVDLRQWWWLPSLKMMVKYEDDYQKNIISKQNHIVSYFRMLSLLKLGHIGLRLEQFICLPYSGTNGFWPSILKTMLLSEAWLEEFKQCIIRKHIHHTSWNIIVIHPTIGSQHSFVLGFFFFGWGTHCIARMIRIKPKSSHYARSRWQI